MPDPGARVTRLEAAMQRRHQPAARLDVAEVLALWRELRRHQHPPAPLPPDLEDLTDAEAVAEWRRIARGDRVEDVVEALTNGGEICETVERDPLRRRAAPASRARAAGITRSQAPAPRGAAGGEAPDHTHTEGSRRCMERT
jgi:hypothetical protein